MTTSSQSLVQYVLARRRPAVLGLLLVLIVCVIGLGVPFILRYAIDALTAGRLTFPVLLACCAAYVGATLLTSALALAMRRVLLGLGHQIEYDIRRDLFAHLTTLDAAFYQRERTGDLMTRLNSDLGAVRDLVGQGLLQASRMVFGFTLAFGIMFALDVRMALTVLGILPCVSTGFFFLVRRIRARYDASQEQFSALSNFAQESFAGVRTLKGFGIEPRRLEGFRRMNEAYVRLNLALARAENPVWPFMALAFSIGIALLLLIGGRQVIEGRITLGTFVQFNQYLLYLQWPMLALGWTTNLWQRAIASWRRLCAIRDARPEVGDGPRTDRALVEPRGDLEFRGVSLSREGRLLLNRVDLVIPEGCTVGITGPTGSGKTLLASLIVRLLDPTEGAVLLGGHDLREIPLAVLRRPMGVVAQEPFLFSDTVAGNIAFGRTSAVESALDEDILWAAEVAHLRADVELFPQKFQTLVGERGVTLSGGQRQRAALSRALARNPRWLILDDAFSAVDTQTEARILDQLRPVLAGRTTILISHRVSTLRHADRIVVIEGGRMTQQGTHAELVARPGYYRTLDEIQRLEARLEEV
jgi:ATP-binding cassette subfamily B multidrug efflux pump